MSMSMVVQSTNSLGGKSFGESITVTASGAIVKDEVLAAAKTGTLTTRTDANTGTLTMAASHGIVDADRIDLYWTNTDGSRGHRRGVVVGTVATNSVPIDLGAGDDLPTAATAITAQVCTELDVVVTGSNVKGILVKTTGKAVVVFADASDVELYAVHVRSGGTDRWYSDCPSVNPLAGDAVAKVFVSQGETTASTVTVGVLYDE